MHAWSMFQLSTHKYSHRCLWFAFNHWLVKKQETEAVVLESTAWKKLDWSTHCWYGLHTIWSKKSYQNTQIHCFPLLFMKIKCTRHKASTCECIWTHLQSNCHQWSLHLFYRCNQNNKNGPVWLHLCIQWMYSWCHYQKSHCKAQYHRWESWCDLTVSKNARIKDNVEKHIYKLKLYIST